MKEKSNTHLRAIRANRRRGVVACAAAAAVTVSLVLCPKMLENIDVATALLFLCEHLIFLF